MKRMIGLLMMMGMVVGVVGCGDDNNPVKSDEDLLVGAWSFVDRSLVNSSSDGTSVSTVGEIELAGIWSLTGDKCPQKVCIL